MSVFALLVGLSLFTAAHAQGPRPTVHEYIPNLGEDEAVVFDEGRQPAAIVYEGEVLTAPEPGPPRPGETPVRASDPAARPPSFRPDRVTELTGRIGYQVVFNPSIAPFKRVTGLDGVSIGADGIPVLTIREPRRRAEPIGGVDASGSERARDRFWGEVILDFSGGAIVPFPAVSPESRVLSLRAEPEVALHLERDGADNLYAVLDGAASGPVRVVFLMDAPADYFGRPLPTAPADAHPRAPMRLPASLEREALLFASELGLRRGMPFDETLSALTEHFRAFEESAEPPRDTGRIFLDLSRGMRGVCRHRAYAFVLTSLALGLPSRFVQNEAHAWVEVALPFDEGWMRVDLGGAATGLDPRGGEDRVPHRPAHPDPLPRPEAYREAYAEAARQAQGRAGAATSPSGDMGSSGSGSSSSGERASPVASESPAAGGLVILLDRLELEVFRGRELELTGTLRGPEGGVSGLRVEASLRGPGVERLLGVTVTREHGRFRGLFGVPSDLPVGDYELEVRTPGGQGFGPALVR